MFLPQLSVNIATTVSRSPLRRSELSLPIVDPRFLQITLDYLHCPDSSPAKDGEDMEDNPIISYRRTKGALRRFFGTGSHFYMTGFKMENGTSVSFPLADDFSCNARVLMMHFLQISRMELIKAWACASQALVFFHEIFLYRLDDAQVGQDSFRNSANKLFWEVRVG